MVGDMLDEDYDGDVIHQPKHDFCKNPDTGRHLPYDFGLDCKVIIEVDGEQHFSQVSSWKGHEETQDRDVHKTKCAVENGYTVVRVLWSDVFYNKNNWRERLEPHLRKHTNPRTILLDSAKNLYGPLMEKLKEEGVKYVIS
jgi:hypothetical protein